MAYDIEAARAAGLTDKEIRAYLSNSGRNPTEINSIMGEVPKEPSVKSEKSSIFPSGPGAINRITDILNIPTRAAATVTGQSMTDPEAYALRPLVEKAKPTMKSIAAASPGTINGVTGPDMSSFIMSHMPQAAEMAGRVLSDPTTYLGVGLLAKGGKVALGAAKKVVSLPELIAGGLTERAGKSILKHGMKIEKGQAIKAGETLAEGKKNIIENISKYNKQSIKGFGGTAAEAKQEISEAMKSADEIIEKAVKDNPASQIDVQKVFLEFMDDVKAGKVRGIPADEIDRAEEIASSLYGSYEKYKNVRGVVPLNVANDIKRDLGKKVFKKGALHIEADPLKAQVKEILNLRMRDAIGEVVPEVTKLNRKVHDLIQVRQAAEAAASRQANWNNITLTDMLFGLGAGAGGHAAMGVEGMAAAAVPALLRRVVGGGKGAGALIHGGKGIKKMKGTTAASAYLYPKIDTEEE